MNSTGVITMNKGKARRSYRKKYLFIDIVSILPVVFILHFAIPGFMDQAKIQAPNLLRLFGFVTIGYIHRLIC